MHKGFLAMLYKLQPSLVVKRSCHFCWRTGADLDNSDALDSRFSKTGKG
jgi:hypothetical protein